MSKSLEIKFKTSDNVWMLNNKALRKKSREMSER